VQKSGVPKTIFNCKKEGSDEYQWNHLPVEVTLPCILPISLLRSGISTCWEVTGPSENPIKAAVRVGCFMKVELLKQLYSELMFLIPEKGKGSGAQGRLVKIDYAKGLVNHFFGGSPDAEKNRMLQAIMGTLKKISECPQAVLAALKQCDPDTAADFSFVQRQCDNQIDLEKKAVCRTQDESFREQLESTPDSLKCLVPKDSDGRRWGYINRSLASKRYQAVMRGTLLSFFLF